MRREVQRDHRTTGDHQDPRQPQACLKSTSRVFFLFHRNRYCRLNWNVASKLRNGTVNGSTAA
jgi:hypothetical protein